MAVSNRPSSRFDCPGSFHTVNECLYSKQTRHGQNRWKARTTERACGIPHLLPCELLSLILLLNSFSSAMDSTKEWTILQLTSVLEELRNWRFFFVVM